MLIASKWKFKNEILDLDFLANQVSNSQSVVVVRPLQAESKKEINDKAILGKKKEIMIPPTTPEAISMKRTTYVWMKFLMFSQSTLSMSTRALLEWQGFSSQGKGIFIFNKINILYHTIPKRPNFIFKV